MKKKEMRVASYQLICTPETRAKNIQHPSGAKLEDILTELTKAFSKKHFLTEVKSKLTLLAIDDIHKSGSNEFQILMSLADSDKPDPVMKNMQTRQRRAAGKTANDGLDVSTHILIRCDQNGKTARLLLTRGGRISSAIVIKFLNRALRAMAGKAQYKNLFVFKRPSGDPSQTYEVRYEIHCDSEKNQTISDALNGGVLKEIVLVNQQTPIEYDQNTQLYQYESAITLKPQNSINSPSKIIKFIKGERANYDTARIRFKMKSSTDMHERTLLTSNVEEAFTLSKTITLSVDVQSVYHQINNEIIGLMRKF